jgi:hypothetical protein
MITLIQSAPLGRRSIAPLWIYHVGKKKDYVQRIKNAGFIEIKKKALGWSQPQKA